MITLKKGMKILFDGDSITDCERDRSDKHSLSGYVQEIADRLAGKGIEIFNRGISGNRSAELKARFTEGLDEIEPDVVSVLIGVNDTWRGFDANDPTSAEQYRENYRCVLQAARDRGAKIIMLEPFLLPVDSSKAKFREDLDFKIDAARELAREFADEYVPLDGLFNEEALHTPCNLLSADGVHPTKEGNRKIAEWWLQRANA